MEQQHKTKIRRRFRDFAHKCQVWGIPDIYGLMDDALVHKLRVKAENFLEDSLTSVEMVTGRLDVGK